MIISIPSVIILTVLFHFAVGRLDPLQHADALRARVPADVRHRRPDRIPLGFNFGDLYLHDTYYVIAHFHYIVAPGTIFALFAGIYYWFPKSDRRMMSEFWGKVHFWPSLIFMNLIFLPMFLQGMAGMTAAGLMAARTIPRRRETQASSARLSGFDHGFERSISHRGLVPGPRADSVHHQFLLEHQAREEGHERQSVGSDHAGMADADAAAARQFRQDRRRSIAGRTNTACRARRADFTLQNAAGDHTAVHASDSFMEIPYTVTARPDTGLYNAKVGIWLFLASEVMLFGGLFSAYILLRLGATRALAARLAERPGRHDQHRRS